MAQRTVYIDDITKKEIPHGEGGTVRVGLDGQWWEVDLSDDSKTKLEELLSPYLVNRAPSTASRTSSGPRRVTGPNDAGDIRWWANETEDGQALLKQLKIDEVKPRGQINKEVRSGWEDAGKPRKA